MSHLCLAARSLGIESPDRLTGADADDRPGGSAQKRINHSALSIPEPLCRIADQAIGLMRALFPDAQDLDFHGRQLLFERAAIFGYGQPGRISSGGSCRLINTADGMIAINLARETDWELLPAWLEQDVAPQDWSALEGPVRNGSAHELIERGRELGLALASVPNDAGPRPADIRYLPFVWGLKQIIGDGRGPVSSSFRPRVVDLTSLWAGPLCGQLLQQCGAEVIKIESIHRPDGARGGPREFFDLMNAGKQSVALDFSSAAGRDALKQLICSADIVLEASRPRALAQLGIDAEEIVDEHASSWISITGYGRQPPQGDWIAFGDDAAVAAGLGRRRPGDGKAAEAFGFVGDAIADPLTGMHAALLAMISNLHGGGQLIDVSLAGIARECLESVMALQESGNDCRNGIETGSDLDCGTQRSAREVAARLGQHSQDILASC